MAVLKVALSMPSLAPLLSMRTAAAWLCTTSSYVKFVFLVIVSSTSNKSGKNTISVDPCHTLCLLEMFAKQKLRRSSQIPLIMQRIRRYTFGRCSEQHAPQKIHIFTSPGANTIILLANVIELRKQRKEAPTFQVS